MISLEPLTEEVAVKAAKWRAKNPEACRTPYEISDGQQREWFSKLPFSKNRYWSVVSKVPVGMVGLTDISMENRCAEISIVMDPTKRGKGFGKQAVDALLDMAFNRMNLHYVYGECYVCACNLDFWDKALMDYPVEWRELPIRKYWNGEYFGSYYFSIRSKG
jgi:RimJ/RimL family protein N-acetyltransferase